MQVGRKGAGGRRVVVDAMGGAERESERQRRGSIPELFVVRESQGRTKGSALGSARGQGDAQNDLDTARRSKRSADGERVTRERATRESDELTRNSTTFATRSHSYSLEKHNTATGTSASAATVR